MLWDTAHWLDRVMEKMREKTATSAFLKRLIKRSNRYTQCLELDVALQNIQNILKNLVLKNQEFTVTFATTRFFSLAITQWKRILDNYKQLLSSYIEYREDLEDDCDETKFEVRKSSLKINSDILYSLFYKNW